MSFAEFDPMQIPAVCTAVREDFSAYLDGAVSGVAMGAIAEHLDGCGACASEFAALRTLGTSLAGLGPAHPPTGLQAQLRTAIAAERERGTHLSPGQLFGVAWQNWLASAAVRFTARFAVTLTVLCILVWMFGAPMSVQANDDNLAHLIAPHYMYSQVPPQPIETGRDVPILVEAKVDTEGRVYDYAIVTGPDDPAVKLRVEQNLLASVFKPATVFGIPVRGQIVMTYTGVSVRG